MERFAFNGETLDRLKSFLDIPKFEVVTERSEVLKYLKAGMFEEVPYRVFGQKTTMLSDDRVSLSIQTPNDLNGEAVGEFHLEMTEAERKGLWRLIDKSRKETSRRYKKYLKESKKIKQAN